MRLVRWVFLLGLASVQAVAASNGASALHSLTDDQLEAVIQEVVPEVRSLTGLRIDTATVRARVLPQKAVRREQLREHLVTLGVEEPLLSHSLETAESLPLSRRAEEMRQVMERISTASLLPATGQMVLPVEQVRKMNLDELRANVAHELVHVAQLQSHPGFFEEKAELERELAEAAIRNPRSSRALEARHAARMTLIESHARLVEDRARETLYASARFTEPLPAGVAPAGRVKQGFYEQTQVVATLEKKGLLSRAFRDTHAAELLFRRGGQVYIELPRSYSRDVAERRVEAYAQIHSLGMRQCGFTVVQGARVLRRVKASL